MASNAPPKAQKWTTKYTVITVTAISFTEPHLIHRLAFPHILTKTQIIDVRQPITAEQPGF